MAGRPAGPGLRLARAVGRSLLLLWVASVVIFFATASLPGDAVLARYLGKLTPEDLARMRQEAGLDRGLLPRYLEWTGGLLHGDLGTSLATQRPVSDLVGQRLGVSLTLCVFTLAVTIPAMILLAWLAAQGGRIGQGLGTVLAIGGSAVPIAVTGILLALLVGKITGQASAVAFLAPGVPAWRQLDLLLVPMLTLALPSACYGAGMLRGAWADAAAHPSIFDARVRGVPTRVIVLRDILPRIAPVALRICALVAGGVLGGAAVVEVLFGIAGLGELLVTAVSNRDLPVVQAVALLSATVVAAGFLIADLAAESIGAQIPEEWR